MTAHNVATRAGSARALAGRELGGLQPGVTLSPTGVSIAADLAFDAWMALGRRLVRISDASAWWIGDWLVYGEWRYGEKYQVAMDQLQLSYDRLRDYAYVANSVPVPVRRPELTFRHHRLVAKLSIPEQEEWLARAVDGAWSARLLAETLDGRMPRTAARAAIRAAQPILDHDVRIPIDSVQQGAWREAAGHAGLDLQRWAVRTLDQAAVSGSYRAQIAAARAADDRGGALDLSSLAEAVDHFARGGLVALVNDLDPQGWSALAVAAEHTNELKLKLMIRAGTGSVSLCLPPERCDELRLGGNAQSRFTVSDWIVHRDAPTTNFYEMRVFTIHRVIDAATEPADLVSPGVIPIIRTSIPRGAENALYPGAGVELARRAALCPATALTGLPDEDGNAMPAHAVTAFARLLDIKSLALSEVAAAPSPG